MTPSVGAPWWRLRHPRSFGAPTRSPHQPGRHAHVEAGLAQLADHVEQARADGDVVLLGVRGGPGVAVAVLVAREVPGETGQRAPGLGLLEEAHEHTAGMRVLPEPGAAAPCGP